MGINVICIVLLMIHMFSAEDASCYKTSQECRAIAWREWESCRGLCKHPTQQVRKRTICIDNNLVFQLNLSREGVIEYCNITQPTLEYRPCPICPTGVYSEESQKCELCGKLFSLFCITQLRSAFTNYIFHFVSNPFNSDQKLRISWRHIFFKLCCCFLLCIIFQHRFIHST